MLKRGNQRKETVPAQTTNTNLTRSLYSSLPSFIRTYAYAASSSASVALISDIAPLPEDDSVRLSDVADAYWRWF
jgi:hypothetical protein